MRSKLGAPLSEVQSQIARIGSGDFKDPIPVNKGMQNSVMSWLSETQQRLSKARADNDRLTRFYATLSYYNEAIVRSKDSAELFNTICRVAVNISAIQFRDSHFPDLVTSILDEENLPHHYLELELTEAAAMDNPEAAVKMMDKLDSLGIRMSIDDFGTGYSSLSYLKRFKVYKLKIDRSFVCDITEDAEDKAIVAAIFNMASSLGVRTIAEGVETAGQLAFLRLQGCNEVQGYYFSRPVPADKFEAYVRESAAIRSA
jgi:EAL domain-containing protein (putative c-di-GMP-specific phosphodiesterase class I)